MPEQTKRLLVVDDDQDIRETLSELLSDEGYSVESAANGQDALERLRSGPLPDIILLDLMMPVMDGYQFRDEQRRDPQLADVPVVVITAGASPQMALLGLTTVVPKPLDLGRLLKAIERIN